MLRLPGGFSYALICSSCTYFDAPRKGDAIMARTVDTLLIGALFGYTPEEALSIRDVKIPGNGKIEVTRFVKNPDLSGTHKISNMKFDGSGCPVEVDSRSEDLALVVTEFISWKPGAINYEELTEKWANTRGAHPRDVKYVELSGAAIKALKKLQW